MITMNTEKEAYMAPQLIVHGNVEVITQGSSCGSRLDTDEPAGESFDDLTFSGEGGTCEW